MAVKPIIFSGPMVRALLAGSKTQTRRVLKDVRDGEQYVEIKNGHWYALDCRSAANAIYREFKAPFAVGDLLWVRETVKAVERQDGSDGVTYLADDHWQPIPNTRAAAEAWTDLYGYRGKRGATVPPIHMPRWASRLTLEVTGVKVQRLQDISEADVEAEGTEFANRPFGDWKLIPGIWDLAAIERGVEQLTEPPAAIKYAYLWNTINAEPGRRWADNPWVVAVTFAVHKANVDGVVRAGAKRRADAQWQGAACS